MNAAIIAAAEFVKICPALLYAMCSVESGLRSQIINPDDGGEDSIGLCQIKVGTARIFNKGVTKDVLLDPYMNAYFAALYLDKQINRYPGNIRCAIAAYNAGRCKKNEKGQLTNKAHVNKVATVYNSLNAQRLFGDSRSCPKTLVRTER